MRTVIIIVFLIAGLISFPALSHPSVGIVMDSKGNVFYTDLVHVWKINTQGVKSIAVRSVHTHELFMDDEDNLFGEHLWYDGASDKWGHFVWKLSSNGRLEKIIPDSNGFLENYSFVRDHDGNMYWADRTSQCQKIAQKSRDGSVKKLGDQCFQNIRYMISSEDGTVYAVDFQDVKKLDHQGKVTTITRKIANKNWTQSTRENQNSVMGIWMDAKGNLYTAVYSSRQVKKFDENGDEEIVLETNFPWAPCGGMVSSNGELWILETSNTNAVRVERILMNNQRIVY